MVPGPTWGGTLLKRLFAVSIALAIACLIPAGASAAPAASDSSLKILSAKAAKSGKSVQVRVQWDMRTRGAAKANKRFVLRILAHGERGRKNLRRLPKLLNRWGVSCMLPCEFAWEWSRAQLGEEPS